MEGGCFCGKIRFTASKPPMKIGNCHCDNCKKSVGAPFVTWAIFKEDSIRLNPTPSSHTADNGAIRTFCGSCGTSLTYWHPNYKNKIDVVLTGLDEYKTLKPKSNVWMQKKFNWLDHLDTMKNFDEFT